MLGSFKILFKQTKLGVKKKKYFLNGNWGNAEVTNRIDCSEHILKDLRELFIYKLVLKTWFYFFLHEIIQSTDQRVLYYLYYSQTFHIVTSSECVPSLPFEQSSFRWLAITPHNCFISRPGLLISWPKWSTTQAIGGSHQTALRVAGGWPLRTVFPPVGYRY